MRKKAGSSKVARAIAIALAAVITFTSTPITVLADEDGKTTVVEGESGSGDSEKKSEEGSEDKKEEGSEDKKEEVKPSENVQDVIDAAGDAYDSVTPKTEKGTVDYRVEKVDEAVDKLVEDGLVAEKGYTVSQDTALKTLAGVVDQNLEKAVQEAANIAQEEANINSSSKTASDKVGEAEQVASDYDESVNQAAQNIADLNDTIKNAGTIASANAAFEQAKGVKAAVDSEYTQAVADFERISGEYADAVQAYKDAQEAYDTAVKNCSDDADAAEEAMNKAMAAAKALEKKAIDAQIKAGADFNNTVAVATFTVLAAQNAKNQADRDYNNAVNKSKNANTALEKADKANKEAKAKLEKAEKELNSAKVDVAAKEKAVADAEKEAKAAATDWAKKYKDYLDAEKDAKEKEGVASRANTAYDDALKAQQKTEEAIGLQEGIKSAAESAKTAAEADVNSLTTQIGTLEGQISTLEGEKSTLEGEIRTLEGQISKIEGQIPTWEGLVEEAKKNTGDLDPATAKANLETYNTELANKKEELEGKDGKGGLKKDLADKQAELAEKNTELYGEDGESGLNKDLNDKKDELTAANKDLAAKEQDLADAEKALNKAKLTAAVNVVQQEDMNTYNGGHKTDNDPVLKAADDKLAQNLIIYKLYEDGLINVEFDDDGVPTATGVTFATEDGKIKVTYPGAENSTVTKYFDYTTVNMEHYNDKEVSHHWLVIQSYKEVPKYEWQNLNEGKTETYYTTSNNYNTWEVSKETFDNYYKRENGYYSEERKDKNGNPVIVYYHYSSHSGKEKIDAVLSVKTRNLAPDWQKVENGTELASDNANWYKETTFFDIKDKGTENAQNSYDELYGWLYGEKGYYTLDRKINGDGTDANPGLLAEIAQLANEIGEEGKSGLANDVKVLEDEIKALEDKIALGGLQAELDTLKSNLASKKKELEGEDGKGGKKKELAEKEAELASKKKDLEGEDGKGGLKKQLEDAQGIVTAAQGSIDAAQDKLDLLAPIKDAQDKAVGSAKAAKDDADKKYKAAVTAKNTAFAELGKAWGKLNTANGALAKAKGELDGAKWNRFWKQDAYNKALREKNSAQTTYANASRQADFWKKEVERTKKIADSKKTALENAQKTAKANIEKAWAEYTKKYNEFEELRKAAVKAQKALVTAQGNVDTLQKELEDLKRNKDDVNAGIKAQIEEWEGLLEQARGVLAAAEQKKNELDNALAEAEKNLKNTIARLTPRDEDEDEGGESGSSSSSSPSTGGTVIFGGAAGIPVISMLPVVASTSGVAGVRTGRRSGVAGVRVEAEEDSEADTATKVVADTKTEKSDDKDTVETEEKNLVKVENNVVPLADKPFEEEGMQLNYLWLLLVAAAIIAGIVVYENHRRKVAVQNESKKYKK